MYAENTPKSVDLAVLPYSDLLQWFGNKSIKPQRYTCIYMYQIIVLYILNLYNATCQLYVNKAIKNSYLKVKKNLT